MRRRGQATLETTLTLLGAALILFGCVKAVLWLTERLVRRQQYYNCTQHEAGSSRHLVWNDPASKISLKMFDAQVVSPNPCS